MHTANLSPKKNMQSKRASTRLASIDILRGLIMLIMLIMLIDHVRERFYYHKPVADPMIIADTEPALFFTRILAHLCAPLFVLLTGISAWLYQHNTSDMRNVSDFLLKRGLFLIVIELTLVNFSWFGNYNNLYLQVIWAIGLSMIVLSFLCHMPLKLLGTLGLIIVGFHNLLTPISFSPDEIGYTFWTILHDRDWLISDGPINVRASYPVLPWIGVILLGYALGPIFSRTVEAAKRRAVLLKMGFVCLGALLVLRGFNIYGETEHWVSGDSLLETTMSFLNFTKYPPSLHYILVTVGIGLILLSLFEKYENKLTEIFKVFGPAPMFFYIVHLYVLLILYRISVAVFGGNQGDLFGVPGVLYIWLITISLAVVLYFPTKRFSQYKHKSSNKLLKFF